MIIAIDYFLGDILMEDLQAETAVCNIITQLQFQEV